MYKVVLESVEELLDEKKIPELKKILNEMMEQDIADILDLIEDTDKILIVFRLLNKELAGKVFAYLESDTKEKIVTGISKKEMQDILDELYTDDFVDLLEEMPETTVKMILKYTDKERRAVVNKYLKYDEDTAGAVMTPEFITLKDTMTVSVALRKIRKEADEKETIDVCYVNDNKGKLTGLVTLADLVLADQADLIKDIMDSKVVTVYTTDEKELVEKRFSNYDLLAMPVIDLEEKMVGIITVDDVIDIIEDEVTEDMEIMAGMEPGEKPYFKSSIFGLAKNRIIWLLILMISATISGAILAKYQVAFAAIPLLVTFIPMITDTGGNCGSQSSTTIIRAMSMGEINVRDFFKVVFKELKVSLIVGVVLSSVNFIRIAIFNPTQIKVAVVVALAMMFTVVLSKLIGGSLPIIAKIFKIDPAIMAGPLICTLVDAMSLIVYFQIATQILNVH